MEQGVERNANQTRQRKRGRHKEVSSNVAEGGSDEFDANVDAFTAKASGCKCKWVQLPAS